MSAEPNGRRGGRNIDRMLAMDLCIDPTLCVLTRRDIHNIMQSCMLGMKRGHNSSKEHQNMLVLPHVNKLSDHVFLKLLCNTWRL